MWSSNSASISEMQCNLSRTDRAARLIVGVGLIAAGVYFRNWWGLLGVPLVVNAVMGVCGLYRLFGFSSYKEKR